jgi:hypothetical protein
MYVIYIVRWYYNQGLCDKWPRMCFTLYSDITIKACVTKDHGCVLHCTVILQSRPVWQMTTDVFYIARWYYNQDLCDKWPRMCFTLYDDITIKACVTNDHGCVLHCTVILQSRPVWQMTTDVFYIVRWYYNQGLCDKWPRMCFTLYGDITIKAYVTNDHGCVSYVVITIRNFPHSWLIIKFWTEVTRRVPLVKQELLTLAEHPISSPFLVDFDLVDLWFSV